MSQKDFSILDLNPDLLSNLNSLGYHQMTSIQEQSLPHAIAGKDVIAQGKTGSGKTAAFGLGLLSRLDVKKFRIQSLVLCPTRELADQVAKELRRLARSIHNIKILTLCGGMPFGPQVGSLEHGAHIIVGTPGRIEDHLNRGTLKLNHVDTLVLDEADRMLEMGFQSAVDAIIECIPEERQTLLFSATYPDQIKSIADRVMHQPVMVKVESSHDNSTIKQHFYKVEDNEQRMLALRLLLLEFNPASSIVFCNTKRDTQAVADMLQSYGFSVLSLHGDLEQRERDQTLVRFANNSACVLVATDVAARGLDIDNLDAVFNFHMAYDPEIHTHRIGRTGRAGKQGLACSLYRESEGHKLAMLEGDLDPIANTELLPDSDVLQRKPVQPTMMTLQIDGGKKQKLRPGDILGALTGNNGIQGKQVGKIQVQPLWAFVAIECDVVQKAMAVIREGKMKGRTFRVRLLRD